MLKSFSNLADITKNFQGILLDAWGVFWGGNAYGLLPGAKEAMEKLILEGLTIGILTNNSQLAAKEIQKLHSHGLIQGKHFHFLITSGELTRNFFLEKSLPFNTPQKKFWLFGGLNSRYPTHEPIFQDSPFSVTDCLEEADFLFVSVPHKQGEDQLDFEIFRADIKDLLKTKLPMVCTNPDRYAHEGTPPRLVVRQGSIAKMYEEFGGKVYYFGKPCKIAYRAAMEEFIKFNIRDPEKVLMIGDTPETDVLGARNFGMPSALVTETGMMAERIIQKGIHVLSSLPLEETPDFYIERFAT